MSIVYIGIVAFPWILSSFFLMAKGGGYVVNIFFLVTGITSSPRNRIINHNNRY